MEVVDQELAARVSVNAVVRPLSTREVQVVPSCNISCCGVDDTGVGRKSRMLDCCAVR